MMFPTFALLSGIALFCSGVAAVTTHQINVSNDTAGLLFDPEYINAYVGDVVVFTFHPKNHSVTQSSFNAPCTPLPGGFDAGFVPVTLGTSDYDLPTRQFTVNDTNPIWIHCRQAANTAASHCGKGMVFAVNPGAYGKFNSFENFKAEALAIGDLLTAVNATM
jgi:plastocyanin